MHRFFVVIAAIVTGAAAAGAQSRPDFTGAWIRAAESAPTVAATGDAGFRTGDMGSGWGSPLTITQRSDSVIIEYVFFGTYDLQPPIRLAYAADGAESANAIMIGHATAPQRARVAWRDSSLVITTQYQTPREVAAPGGLVVVRHTLTLESPTSLVVQTMRSGPAGTTVTVKTTYTKR